jgi:hypothetical protein
MKRIGFIALIALTLLAVSLAFAEGDTTATTTLGISVPTGFNFAYIAIFAFGMILHYAIVIKNKLGMSDYLKNFTGNFIGWFVNKWHYSLIAGGAAAVVALAETYFNGASFATINAIGVIVSLTSGYIGDSAFNQGNVIVK